MRVITSKREWKLIMVEGKSRIEKQIVNLNTIFANDNQGADWEYNYALEDRIDDMLDMAVDDIIFFQHDRDDKNSKSLIIRTK